VQAPQSEAAAREAIRHWSRLPQLAEFAGRRHGFGDSDGGFGVTYPGDLDEYARVMEGAHIPEGFVQVYGYWGLPDGYEVLVNELVYLDTLADALWAAGHLDEAAQVQALAAQQRQA
jgi:attachment invasion locus protein